MTGRWAPRPLVIAGLSVTQVGNWMVNRRKRKWHRQFNAKNPDRRAVILFCTYACPSPAFGDRMQ